MGHTRHRRRPNNTQYGMAHPESLTTWDTQDTGGSPVEVSLPFIINTTFNRLYNTII
jgi:hypothetical protein